MLVKDINHNEVDMYRKAFNDKVIKEGMELWNRQKEFERIKKLKEKREVRTCKRARFCFLEKSAWQPLVSNIIFLKD